MLPAALVLTGCGVPDVNFNDAGSRDATHDSPLPLDAQEEAEAGVDAEPARDAEGGVDAADASDASDSGMAYCKGDAGAPEAGYKCCSDGTVCSGNCNTAQCLLCVGCVWPSVCCPMPGNTAVCKDAGSC